jgi:hypothetical protein
MVTLAVPVSVSVRRWVLLAPTAILPKLMLAGLADRDPVVPVPDKETSAGELLALLTMERLPVTLPVIVGAKRTLNEALWPDARLRGKVNPLRVNPFPAMLAEDRVRPAFPVLVRLTV